MRFNLTFHPSACASPCGLSLSPLSSPALFSWIINQLHRSSVIAMSCRCLRLLVHLLLLLVYCATVTVAVSLEKTHSPSLSSGPPVSASARQLESLSPKRFFDFITDPSLLITVLHSLEVAYWTFPFGFLLKPVINFFRVPNRRSLDSPSSIVSTGSLHHEPTSPSLAGQVNVYQGKLLASLAKYHSLNHPK